MNGTNFYKEKADAVVLEECNTFIDKIRACSVNQNLTSRQKYENYKSALWLSGKLIESLIASQKEFEEAVHIEFEEFEKNRNIKIPFDATYTLEPKLVLDVEAHEVLEKLWEIAKVNMC